ncbi:TPA: hypothetical protein ACRNOT_000342 [Pseudomonas aeruginosa]
MTASKIQMDQIRSTSATVTGENIRAGSQKKSSLSPAEGLQGASPDATCTCPSGNGSLRHPCPAHPAQVEQVGGDERAAFELFVRKHCGMPAHIAVNWDAKFTNDAWEGWKARAALAQPSGEVVVTKNESGAIVSVTRQDKEGRVLSVIAESATLTAQAEQAEAERPEVVAYRTIGRHEKHQHPHYALNYYKQNAEDQAAHWRERGCEVSEDELMTVAQHDRIVGALRAEIAQLRQHKNDYMDAGQETYRALQNEIREREAEIARLDGLVSGRTAERDAALARVAELERGKVYVEARQCDECQHGGINDSATGVAACHECDWTGPEPEEDRCPGCQRENCMAAACPQCGARYVLVASEEIAAPVAQAQRSVPEEFSFEYRHPNGECHTVTVSREQVINEMPDFLFEALCSKFCNCEPVGETNVVECRCDEYAEEFKLLAAAPGKEGL